MIEHDIISSQRLSNTVAMYLQYWLAYPPSCDWNYTYIKLGKGHWLILSLTDVSDGTLQDGWTPPPAQNTNVILE